MGTYVSYELDNGSSVLIETDGAEGSLVPLGRGEVNLIVAAQTKFAEAIRSAKESAILLLEEMGDLQASEVEIVFGLKSTGEAGLFAVAKLGLEVNYQITLKWSQKSKKE